MAKIESLQNISEIRYFNQFFDKQILEKSLKTCDKRGFVIITAKIANPSYN